MKEHAFLSVVVYVRDDSDHLEEELVRIASCLEKKFERFEVLVVNDCSSDTTRRILRSVAAKLSCNFTIINLSRRHGLELAMMAGLEKSIGDFVLEIDTLPLEIPCEMIADLFKKTKEGYDIVAASPGHHVSLKSRLFYAMVNRMSYLQLDLCSERVRIVSRRALNAMLRLREKVRYRKALYTLTGYGKTIVYYTPKQKRAVKSNRENIALAMDVIVSFSNFGLKVSHYLSFVFALFSLLGTGYGLFNYFFNQNVVPGWTTLVVLISLGFAGTFFVLGMIGEYLARVLTEVQNRPMYSVSHIETYKPLRIRRQEHPGAEALQPPQTEESVVKS